MDKTGIANLALGNLGEASIQSLSDNNARARISNARIDDVIRSVLRVHDWNSAMKRVALTKSNDPLFGWNSTFQLPADYIKVIEVWPISKFRVQGAEILSNEDTLNLLYIYEPSDINTLDVLLAEAMSLKLAVEMAETLTGKDGLKDRMMQKYLIAL